MENKSTKTVEEALADYYETLLPNATSFGQTVYVDSKYIGDVWCYCIDLGDTPNCMLSYCIFEPEYQSKGIASAAVAQFLQTLRKKYDVKTVGAFTFSDNTPSIRVLEKNSFAFIEEFTEDSIPSQYFQLTY
jgi:RimJ/RimL family protein N-acetyltransferase